MTQRAARLVWTLVVLLTLSSGISGCSPAYIQGTEIDFSPEKQEVADIVELYRSAIERRDTDALSALVSKNYYENASTTNDPQDDYNHDGLLKVLGRVSARVKAIRYELKITAINIYDGTASVDFDFTGQFLFTSGEQDRWATYADKNRLTFERVQGDWRIVSGL